MNDATKINANRVQLSSNQSASVKERNEVTQVNQSERSSSLGDRVALTSTASRLKDIEQQLNSASSVDTARVAEVQSAISNGEYTVNADRIADKMLSFDDITNT